jgi:hypothetical protein
MSGHLTLAIVAALQMREKVEESRSLADAAHQAEVHRRMHPRTAADFEILYNELEAWRSAETQRINNEGLAEGDRLEALAQLLHKETKLLQTIDRLKITASKENKEKRVAKMLDVISRPKLWETSKGEVTAVHTPFTTRAKELADLCNGAACCLCCRPAPAVAVRDCSPSLPSSVSVPSHHSFSRAHMRLCPPSLSPHRLSVRLCQRNRTLTHSMVAYAGVVRTD